jgi:hypothetical protein
MPQANTTPDMWGCTLKELPEDMVIEAARNAVEHNAVNQPDTHFVAALAPADQPLPLSIAIMTSKYWGRDGVDLTVGFLDNPPRDLRAKILSHMNAWAKTANVAFREEASSGQDSANVRITRGKTGHWSYLGTDIKLIRQGEATMNLQDFTMKTPDPEFFRVVRHETGHTLGSPHEHMRKGLVDLIDEKKAIAYFGRTQGWSADMVRRQVLTPLDPGLLQASAEDSHSIMCYQIPPTITKSGQPIPGGTDIDEIDFGFMATMYPKPRTKGLPSPPPSSPSAKSQETAAGSDKAGAGGRIEIVKGDLRVNLYAPLDPELVREVLRSLD